MITKTVLITGGSGMIGSALAKHLAVSGYSVIILSRNPLKAKARQQKNDMITFAQWDVKKQTVDPSAIASADVIVHLAGAGIVDRPWTPAYKKQIVNSRTNSSALLIKALKEVHNKVQVVVSAAAIGWYGPDENKAGAFVESDPPSPGFIGTTCQQWEASIKPVTELDKRLVTLRFGVVLSRNGGALKEFIKPLMFRIAGVLGTGKQVISWIHIHDLSRLIQFAMDETHMQGVYNAVTPEPVSNEELTVELARAMYGKFFLKVKVPEFVLKIMLGDRRVEVLKSTTVSSEKIEQAGFEFNFPRIQQAMKNLVANDK